MATGAPLPVREYASVDEMRRHAAEVRARLFAPKPAFRESMTPPILRSREPDPQTVKTIWYPPAVFEHLPVVTVAQLMSDAMSTADILRLVAVVTGCSKAEIISQQRGSQIVRARHIVCWLAARYAGLSLGQVGRRLGGRDHTTVLYGQRRVAAVIDALGLDMLGGAQRQARTLWQAEWPKVVFGPDRRPCA